MSEIKEFDNPNFEEVTTNYLHTPETRERLSSLFATYIKGASHMHTVGLNPEGGLEATLSLEQQLDYFSTITKPTPTKGEFPFEFTTVTNHAEHLGLDQEKLQSWLSEGRISQGEYELIISGREKRRILKDDSRITQMSVLDGWSLCSEEENGAMAKSAALELHDDIVRIQNMQDINPDLKIFSGVEASITPDGSLTIQDVNTLQSLDVVIASPHASGFDHRPLAHSPEDLIEVYKNTVKTQPVLIMGHPFIDATIASSLVSKLKSTQWEDIDSEEQKLKKDIGLKSQTEQISRKQQLTTIREAKREAVYAALDPILGEWMRMLKEGKVAFEFNIKSPMPSELEEAMIILAKEYEIPIAIGIDGHQILQWRNPNNQIQINSDIVSDHPELTELTQQYLEKKQPLSTEQRIQLDSLLAKQKAVGPKFLLRLGHLLRKFKDYEIADTQVITSSRDRLQQAIEERKLLVA